MWALATFVALAFAASGAAAVPAHPPQQQTRIAAVLETRAPDVSEFLLRGTVPVPPGTYPRADGMNPFTLLDYDGRPVFTQTEIVSRYPQASGGADVVELLAWVRRDPALALGAPARYPVVYLHQNPPPLEALMPVREEVDDLILDPGAVEVTTYDCFGNRYVARPFMLSQREVLHRGPVHAEVRTYQDMLPRPGATNALPHFFGLHSYVSWSRESAIVGLDLRFHNAHDGHDTHSKLDDPLDKVYFDRIEVSMPEEWVLLQDFADPLFGRERVAGGRRIVELVGPFQGGGLHVMRWGGQFHRRLVLAPARPSAVRAARARLDGAGRAFCTRGFDGRGREYWSWWNRETSRYFPQRHQLPLLDHLGAALDSELDGELAFLTTHLANGSGVGNYPISVGRLGWGHPYGVAYGGMTGGLEINCYDGIVAAAAASPSGFRLYAALHRMQSDRQPNALYQLDGSPSSVEEWVIENGELDYVPFEHFIVPLVFGSRPDPFGVRSAPRFQIDYVQANGLQPSYEPMHFLYDPYDFQHFVRYTRSAKVLAWLANDSLAKDDLGMQAEAFHLSYHSNANSPNGAAQGSGLLSAIRSVQAVPGKGFQYGRGEAWGLDCAAAVYSLSDREWRARKLPWFMQQVQLVLDGQARCSGFIQAAVSPKAVDGKYHARQMIEQSITENAFVGLHESVFREAHPAFAMMVRDVLIDSLRAFVSEMAWFPGEPGPWRYTGVGPLDRSLPVWCTRAQMPGDAWTAGDRETYQDWSSFAYGFELTSDPKFLQYARIQIGAASATELLARLKAAGTSNLQNQAALLALIQRNQGEL